MTAGGRAEDPGAAQIGEVVPVGRQAALPLPVRRQAEHDELGRHTEGERLGEAAVEGVGVGVDQPREKGPAGAVDVHLRGVAVVCGDAVAVDENVRAGGGPLTVEDTDVTDESAHGSSPSSQSYFTR